MFFRALRVTGSYCACVIKMATEKSREIRERNCEGSLKVLARRGKRQGGSPTCEGMEGAVWKIFWKFCKNLETSGFVFRPRNDCLSRFQKITLIKKSTNSHLKFILLFTFKRRKTNTTIATPYTKNLIKNQ